MITSEKDCFKKWAWQTLMYFLWEKKQTFFRSHKLTSFSDYCVKSYDINFWFQMKEHV